MPLDLSGLRKAIVSLERSLETASGCETKPGWSEELGETIRAGVIQNFEVAYELCWKFIQRWVRKNVTPEDAGHPRSRKELFRTAARYGLIADPIPWFAYGDARNLTAHTYDEQKAETVFEAASQFIVDAKYLLERLEEHND
jgi:nucleotidyltransferase substrate binding protein (TIGR01987 family)